MLGFLDDLLDFLNFLDHWRFALSVGAGLVLGLWALAGLPEGVLAWCVFGVSVLAGIGTGCMWEARAK